MTVAARFCLPPTRLTTSPSFSLILLTMPDLETKRRSLEYLRKRGYSGVVAATSYFPEEDEVLSQAGVNLLFNSFIEAGARLARLGTHVLAGLGPLPEAEA
ncbi:hypothetical protein [Candidatus Entotheonella palauensis]|uniref:Uncharacterized protein n=1 Tax=Candidatus Entotheonella gemina TaxID=1429439 RepID=W4MGB4_9BACT|nr:hypothetical protein [Candidatus Entotheonella palauensis]ETX09225.1 MAG: hypothetical protein ETSY2_00750 [Candidatus Entotheonella gemina]